MSQRVRLETPMPEPMPDPFPIVPDPFPPEPDPRPPVEPTRPPPPLIIENDESLASPRPTRLAQRGSHWCRCRTAPTPSRRNVAYDRP